MRFSACTGCVRASKSDMDPLTIIALINAGVTTFQKIKAAHAAGSIALTNEQLNEILQGIASEDDRIADELHKEAHPDD